jgi:hypothetical protein
MTRFPLGARGEHPVFFPAQLSWERIKEITGLPGVVKVPGGLACTWDVAPLLAQQLGVDVPKPPIEEWMTDEEVQAEVMNFPGLDRYRSLGLGQRLRDYQKDGATFLARRAYAINADPMRCLSGQTEIIVNRGGCARRMTLEHFVFKMKGGRTRDRAWQADLDSYLPCYDEEGAIISNKVTAVHTVGRKQAFRLVTASGQSIVSSADHQFRTDAGYVRLQDLRAGDQVLIRHRDAQVQEGPRRNPYRVVSIKNHPHARVYDVQRADRPNEVVHHVLKHRVVYEAEVLNGMSVREFASRIRKNQLNGLRFLDPDAAIHHRDGNPSNNTAANLELIRSREDHSRLHAEEGAYRNVLYRAVPEAIAAIVEVPDVEMFDIEMADPYRNFVANDFVVHNSGKSLQSLAASVLVDAQRTLIVAPALAKWVWADEIAKWLNEEALVLEGRSGTTLRRYCRTCMAKGKMPDGSVCSSCKLRNGQANGFKIFDVRDLLGPNPETGKGAKGCTKHKQVPVPTEDFDQRSCPECDRELHEAIDAARYVIVNYDLLVAQKAKDGSGRGFYRDDLQGWGPALSRHRFDLCIADESHMLRGWESSPAKKGTTRREKFCQVTEYIDRVWLLSGTPIYGYVRDLWGQMDAMSKGALTSKDRLPFMFHARYCEGHRDDYGWRADGRSFYADAELPHRLKVFQIKRPRSEILAAMPPKVRQAIRIDDSRSSSSKVPRFGKEESTAGRITKLLKGTFDVKVESVVENVLGELANEGKVVVFTLLRESAEKIAKALEKESRKKENSTRMQQVDCKIWLAHGDASTQARFAMARSFREHQGAGVFVTTIDAVQVAVSLKGAQSVHFAEMHWQPSAMLQAEDRPYEVGVTGLNILYYLVRGSVDEHIEQVVLPKVETLARVVDERTAVDVKNALLKDTEESVDDLLASLTAHLKFGAGTEDEE